jgi:hypothetical protein
MLDNPPYQHAFSEDLKRAFRERDSAWLHAEIKKLCRLISLRDGTFDNSTRYDHELSRLQVCLALVDSLTRRGETQKLLCDVINF